MTAKDKLLVILQKHLDDAFQCGYACAVATIVSGHGSGTETKEALQSAGLTSLSKLREIKADEYDVKILKPLIKEIQSDRRRKLL